MKHSIDKPILATTGLVGFTASLVGLSSCIGLVLVGSSVSADDVVDDISITVPVSCTMSGSGMNSHTAEIANGTYTPNIGTTTINVLCNDNGGFSIYAAGFTGEEIGATNSNKLVGTSASGNAVIDTGTATSAGNPDVSNWAMKLATNSQATYPITLTTGYDAFHAVPNEYTKVATRLQGTDVGTNAEGSSLTTTYAAYISKTQPADTYSGKVKYVLLHPNTETPPTPGSVEAAYFDAGKTKYKGYYTMQDMTPSMVSSINDDQTGTLIDTRDDSTYTIAKLNGAIWMTQNLRITGVVPAEGSNFSTYSSINVCEGDLTAGYSFDEPRCHDSGNTTNGVWYNYAAASAKTIIGTSNNTLDTENICPANWSLPSYDTNKPAGSVNSLAGAGSVTTTAFSPVTGGRYSGGSVGDTSRGDWWSTTASNTVARHNLYYSDDSNLNLSTSNGSRSLGCYIRCVRVAE